MESLKQRIPLPIYNRLIEANINSVHEIISTGNLILLQRTKLSSEEIEHVVQEAAALIVHNNINTALEVPAWLRITSGCNIIDLVIRGGIPVNGVTEIFGTSGVGKTQFCLQLSLTVQLPTELGGLGKGAVYICTEDTFPSKRLNTLIKTFPKRFNQLNNFNFEDKIFVEHISEYEQMRRCLFVKLPQLLAQQSVGIIIIDSIAGIFRSETVSVNYTTRSEELFTIASKLNKLQDEFNVAVVCVNQVTCNIETTKTEPCLGLAWSNMVTSRFQLSKNELDNIRTFKVIFAPDLPNGSCNFSINDLGIAGIS